MQKLFQEIDLQFFAGEGASSGDGSGSAPAGVGAQSAAADAGHRDQEISGDKGEATGTAGSTAAGERAGFPGAGRRCE